MEDRKRQENKRKLLHSVFLQKLGDGIAFFDIKLEVMITDRFSKCQMLTNKYCRPWGQTLCDGDQGFEERR